MRADITRQQVSFTDDPPISILNYGQIVINLIIKSIQGGAESDSCACFPYWFSKIVVGNLWAAAQLWAF